MFLMDNDPGPISAAYTAGRPSLQGRVLFTNARPGRPDAAFVKRDEPTGANLRQIKRLVRTGYLVRTRSDEPLVTVLSRDMARKRIGALPGYGKMKITGFGSVLALHFGVEAAQELVPEHPCLGRINSPEDLAEYQAAKRAHKAALRAAAATG